MNGTTNMRTIIFSQHKSLDLCFHEENKNNFKIKDFLFLQKKIDSFLCILRKEENIFLHHCFQEKREKTYSFSLWFSTEKILREREFSLKREQKNLFIYLFKIMAVSR